MKWTPVVCALGLAVTALAQDSGLPLPPLRPTQQQALAEDEVRWLAESLRTGLSSPEGGDVPVVKRTAANVEVSATAAAGLEPQTLVGTSHRVLLEFRGQELRVERVRFATPEDAGTFVADVERLDGPITLIEQRGAEILLASGEPMQSALVAAATRSSAWTAYPHVDLPGPSVVAVRGTGGMAMAVYAKDGAVHESMLDAAKSAQRKLDEQTPGFEAVGERGFAIQLSKFYFEVLSVAGEPSSVVVAKDIRDAEQRKAHLRVILGEDVSDDLIPAALGDDNAPPRTALLLSASDAVPTVTPSTSEQQAVQGMSEALKQQR